MKNCLLFCMKLKPNILQLLSISLIIIENINTTTTVDVHYTFSYGLYFFSNCDQSYHARLSGQPTTRQDLWLHLVKLGMFPACLAVGHSSVICLKNRPAFSFLFGTEYFKCLWLCIEPCRSGVVMCAFSHNSCVTCAWSKIVSLLLLCQ